MGIFDDNKFIEITQDDVKDAVLSSSNLDDSIKQRAFANVIGGRLGIKYLKSIGFNTTNQNSLYTIPAVLKDLDIADISLDNIKIDVRIVPNEDTLFVPKAQFEFNVTPDIYIFLTLSQDLSTANFVGAISPDEINKSKEANGYYIVDKGILYNENSLKKALKKTKPKSNLATNENDIIKAQALIVNFIDGDIMNKEKHFLYEQLLKSSSLCEMFRNFQHFELVSKDLAQTNEILSDSVLDVLGAQQLYNEDITLDEFGSDVNLDEIADATVADFVEDYIEENHDEEDTMNFEDNNIIDGEFEEKGEEVIEEAGQLEELPSDEELANFETFEPEIQQQEENFELEDLTPDNLEPSLNTGTFEGFVGLEPQISPSDLEDITSNHIDIENLDLGQFNDEGNQQNENPSSNAQEDTLEEKIPEEISDEFATIDEIAQDSNINFLDVEDIPDLQGFGEVENLEGFENIDNIDNFSEFENSNMPELEDVNDNSTTQAEESSNNDEPQSLMDTVKNEGIDMQEQHDMTDLEAFETPIDLTLPELEPDDDLPMVEEVSEPQQHEEVPSNDENPQLEEFSSNDNLEILEPVAPLEDLTPQTLDDIAEPVNFSQPDEISDTTTLQDSSAQVNDAPEEVDLSNFEMEHVQEENNQHQDSATSSSNNSDDDDDMSGLEEFTMDMAAAVEEANPNLNNPQVPVDDAMNDAFSAFNDFSSFNDDSSSTNQTSEETNKQNSPLEDINLDDLDDDDLLSDAQSSQSDINPDNIDLDSEIDNLVNSDIDLSEINLDDIDLNDPDIQNVDLDFSDEDFNNTNYNQQPTQPESAPQMQINDIPDMSAQNDMQYNQDSNIPQGSQNYDPNFAANDQSTIETLYDNTQQGQMGNDAMDNTLNQNNINMNNNFTKQPKKQDKKKTSPLLGILLIVLLIAFAYTKKDLIMEKVNANKGIQTQQDQNMPIEGESQEDKDDAQMLRDNTEMDQPNGEEAKQPIGAIPGEAGGPQDVASMEASLKQGKDRLKDKNLTNIPTSPQAPLYTNNIKKLYWEVPQELTYNDAVVKYLKITGRTIKLAVQSDLLNATELPYSSRMIVNVQISKSGEVTGTDVTVSSGSKQIDSIVLQSVKAALKYVKAPTSEFTKDSYNFSLIINF